MQQILLLRLAVGLSYVCSVWYAFHVWTRLRGGGKTIRKAIELGMRAIKDLLQTRCSPSLDDPFEAQVKKITEQRRLDLAFNFRLLSMHLLAPWIFWYSLLATYDGVWGSMESDRVYFHLTINAFSGAVFIDLCCLALVYFKRLNTPRVLDAVYVGQGLRVATMILSTPSFATDNPWLTFTRFTAGLVCGNIFVATPINIMMCVIVCWAHGQSALAVDADSTAELFPVHVRSHMVREAFITVIIIAFCWLMEHTRVTEVRATLASKSSEKLATSFQGLLSVLCDVVVHLTDELCVSTPSSQLATFVLSGKSGESMQGCSLADLMIADDGGRFRDWIADFGHESNAQSLNVMFKGAGGINVNARIHHVPYENISGQLEHIVGITEVGSSSGAAPDFDALPAMSYLPRYCGADSSANSSTSSTCSDTSLCLGEDSFCDGIMSYSPMFNVSCDPFNEPLNILACDLDFSLICGFHAVGYSLLEWVTEPEVQCFFAWVKSQANRILCKDPGIDSNGLSVTLRTPLANRLGVDFEMLCNFSTLEGSEERERSYLLAPLSFVFVRHKCRLYSEKTSMNTAVACNLSDRSLTIRQSTLGFSLLCGFHPEGESLLPWILQPVDFYSWVQKQAARWYTSGESGKRKRPRSKEVLLQPPLPQFLHVQFTARCYVCCMKSDVANSVQLFFTDVERLTASSPVSSSSELMPPGNRLVIRRRPGRRLTTPT